MTRDPPNPWRDPDPVDAAVAPSSGSAPASGARWKLRVYAIVVTVLLITVLVCIAPTMRAMRKYRRRRRWLDWTAACMHDTGPWPEPSPAFSARRSARTGFLRTGACYISYDFNRLMFGTETNATLFDGARRTASGAEFLVVAEAVPEPWNHCVAIAVRAFRPDFMLHPNKQLTVRGHATIRLRRGQRCEVYLGHESTSNESEFTLRCVIGKWTRYLAGKLITPRRVKFWWRRHKPGHLGNRGRQRLRLKYH